MVKTRSSVVAALVVGGAMLASIGAMAAPAPHDPVLGERAPLVQEAQLYIGVPGIGVGVAPAPYY